MRGPFLSQSTALRYGVVFLLYFRQGLPAGFAQTALANSLTARGVNAAEVGAFVAWIGLPWTLQFVWGPLIDRFQGSAMGRRRPWVLGAQLLGLVATLPLLFIVDPVEQLAAVSWIFLAHSVVASVQDTGVDAMAISMTPDRQRGRMNAFMRAGFLVGLGAGAMLSVVMKDGGFRAAAGLQTIALALLAVLTFVVRERPGDALLPGGRREGMVSPRRAGMNVSAIVAELIRGMLAPTGLRIFLASAIGYLAASVFSRAVSFHLIRNAGWGDAELSVFSGWNGTALALVVVLLGGPLSDRIGHGRLLVAVLALMGGYLIAVGSLGASWSDRSLMRPALAIWYGFDPLLSVAAMPALMAVCRPGVEGSQFTAYMALVNLCDVLGSYLAGKALGFASAPTIAAACGAAALASAAGLLIAGKRRDIPNP